MPCNHFASAGGSRSIASTAAVAPPAQRPFLRAATGEPQLAAHRLHLDPDPKPDPESNPDPDRDPSPDLDSDADVDSKPDPKSELQPQSQPQPNSDPTPSSD